MVSHFTTRSVEGAIWECGQGMLQNDSSWDSGLDKETKETTTAVGHWVSSVGLNLDKAMMLWTQKLDQPHFLCTIVRYEFWKKSPLHLNI